MLINPMIYQWISHEDFLKYQNHITQKNQKEKVTYFSENQRA